MSLKINLEIGHEATLRTKNTPEGFTHDWKIFVRGCDGANIHYFVEKVVFYLHETFQKPRRVIKEPPYSVKESGYAGFIIPIEVYLRNSGEPKKVKFSYDLTLQRTGPPLRKVRKEKYIFTSPPEDFKEKLLRGGAVVTSNSQEISENKSILHEEKNQLISKPKLSGESPPKKPKLETPISNSFQDLFGTPITKTSKVQDPKVSTLSKENKTSAKSDKDRVSDKTKSKHSPHKEKEKDKSEKKDKKEEKKKDKERRDKDRDKNKEKSSKMERSPKVRSPSPKNPSPKPSSPQTTQSTSAEKYREKDNKNEKEKKDKGDEEEKKIKKEKKERESIKEKEKHRDKGESKHKEIRSKEASLPQESAAASGVAAEPEMPENKQEKKENQKEDEKSKTERTDKSEEKKHKHKKRDKHKKERKDEDERTTKVPEKAEEEKDQFNHTDQLFSNTSSHSLVIDMSESNNLFGSDENLDQTSGPHSPRNTEEPMEIPSQPPSYVESSDSSPIIMEEEDDEMHEGEYDSPKKRKRSEDSDIEESPAKLRRAEKEPLSGEEEEEIEFVDEADNGNKSSSDNGLTSPEIDMNNRYTFDPPDDAYSDMDAETFTKLCALKERIMLVTDNDRLQEIVEVISDTGLYGVSKTFDFDLSEMDQNTVEKLQEMLPPLPSPPPPEEIYEEEEEEIIEEEEEEEEEEEFV